MRPRFHFTGAGWINDPHGITVHAGRYHAFYQSVPGRDTWDLGCRWGHAVGADLVSLVELPPVLAPGDGEDGIWTGSLVTADDGVARIFYTAVDARDLDRGRVRVATPLDDGWVDWQKGEVVVDPSREPGLRTIRDPAVRRDDDGWRMLLGGGTATDGVALSYRSDDLHEWVYEGVAASRPTDDRDPVWTGAGWECPQVVDVAGGHAMIFSVWEPTALHYAVAATGDWRQGVFTASGWRRLSWGPSPYAPSCYTDAAGRLAAVFWLRDVGGEGWQGAHSTPLLVDGADGVVTLAVHPELEAYAVAEGRTGRALLADWDAAPGSRLTLGQDDGPLAELEATDEEIVVANGDGRWRMPRSGAVEIVVDGPVLEAVSATGFFAAPLADDGSPRTLTGDARVRPLVR